MSEPVRLRVRKGARVNQRAFQDTAFDAVTRFLAYIWRRQAGKSTLLGRQGLDWKMEKAGVSVFYTSASLRLGTENLRKEGESYSQIIAETRKELEAWKAAQTELAKEAAQAGFQLKTTADDDKGKILDIDALMDLFEAHKLETRLWHSRTTYSRSMVVAPNPETAVGWTGHMICDEVGRMPFFKALMEAIQPIIASNPQFLFRMATTPPPDDAHHSYELLAPPEGMVFAASARGNFYRSQAGLLCHRVDAFDAYLAGTPIYDFSSGEALAPLEARARDFDKDGFDRNYLCKFIRGGASALTLNALNRAAASGDDCLAIDCTEQLVLPS